MTGRLPDPTLLQAACLYPQRSPDSADFYMWGSIQDCLQTGDGDNFKYLNGLK
jgi:hypothetical protein